MKRLLFAMALFTVGFSLIAAQAPSTVTYADHDKVAAAIANGGQLANGPDFAISMLPNCCLTSPRCADFLR